MIPKIDGQWIRGFLEPSETAGSVVQRGAPSNESSSAFTISEETRQVTPLIYGGWGSPYAELVKSAARENEDCSESTISLKEASPTSASHTGKIVRSNAIYRIDELKQCAADEGITVNESSQWDLLKFVATYLSEEDLNIFLLDGGTFHVIKRLSDEREVGVEFLGGGQLRRTVVTGSIHTGAYSASSEFIPLRVSCN